MKYTNQQIETFLSFKHAGTIKSADVSARVVSKECGDIFKIYANIDGDKISEAKFLAVGSVTVFNTMTYVVELILGKKIADLQKIKRADLIAYFDRFSSGKYAILDNALILIEKLYVQSLKFLAESKQKSKKRKVQTVKTDDDLTALNVKSDNLTTLLLDNKMLEQCKNLAKNEKQINKMNVLKDTNKTETTSKKAESKNIKVSNGRRIKASTTKNEEMSFEESIKKTSKKNTPKKISSKKNNLLDENNFDMVDEIDSITARLSEAVSKLKNGQNE